MKEVMFDDGLAILGDGTSRNVLERVRAYVGQTRCMMIADPPYGNILPLDWDKWKGTQEQFVDWMTKWTVLWSEALPEGGAMYVWGGVGRKWFRPFFAYLHTIEHQSPMQIGNVITWKKKRSYGVQHNYLFTREELVYLVKGDPKKPDLFNVPYLDEKRGYAGYNDKYPAKSEYLRRSNVWADITELLTGKIHDAQKPMDVYRVPIEARTAKGDIVIDPFAGSFTLAHAARLVGRKWVCVESDEETFNRAVDELRYQPRRR